MSDKTVPGHDEEIYLHLDPKDPLAHQINYRDQTATQRASNFRTVATQRLQELFPNKVWVTREGFNGQQLEIRLTIATQIAEEFRKQVEALGFKVIKKSKKSDENPSDGTGEIYDHQ